MSQRDLTILVPQRKQEKIDPRWSDLDPRLPVPPFLAVFNGPMKSGKTVSMINFIYNDNFYANKFDSKLYMSPSLEEDDSMEMILNDDSFTKITGDRLADADSILQFVVEAQRDRVKAAKADGQHPPHMLIVLDDMLGMLGENFKYLCTRLRHPRITLFVSTQNFRSLPVTTRQNAMEYYIFNTGNKKEIAKYDEEFSGNFPSFKQLYDQATADQYSFLRLDLKNGKAYKRFDDLIYQRWENGKQPPPPSDSESDSDEEK